MVPDPPHRLKPRLVTWPAHQPFYRVFHLDYAPIAFNPGRAGDSIRGRFHSFRDAKDRIVPALYGTDTEDGAIAETILQLSAQRSQRGRIRETRFQRMAIVSIEVTIELRLIELYGSGLRALRLLPEEITSTSPSEYPRTVAWAKALHTAAPEAHGLLWMSHQFNTSKAMMLFGDRVDEQSLAAVRRPLPLSTGRGRTLVERAANRAGITII